MNRWSMKFLGYPLSCGGILQGNSGDIRKKSLDDGSLKEFLEEFTKDFLEEISKASLEEFLKEINLLQNWIP